MFSHFIPINKFGRNCFTNVQISKFGRSMNSSFNYKAISQFNYSSNINYDYTHHNCNIYYNNHTVPRFFYQEFNKNKILTNFGRKVFIDVETTGLNHYKDRIIEICAIEVINGKIGSQWHSYVNPCGRKSSKKAQECHRFDANMLKTKPKFSEIVNRFLDFIGNSTLVAHNAQFDIHFINSELKRSKKKPLTNNKICTLKFSRKLNPTKKKHTLNALCDRYNINKEIRDKYGHNSKIDTELLTKVYDKLWNEVQQYDNRDEIISKSEYHISDDKWI